MWIPYNLLAPLKAETPKATILASEEDTSPRRFVVGFYLRNPVTRNWDCDVMVAGNDGPRTVDIEGCEGTILLTAGSSGKLEQIIYTLPSSGAEAALALCYRHVVKCLDSMILQYGRGIEVAGWQIADVEHEARWRCVPFRPSALMPSPDLRDAPPAYGDILRLYRESRCATSSHWRLICAGAIVNAAVKGRAPFTRKSMSGSHDADAAVVTTDILIRSGAIVSYADLKGASLARVRERIEPHRQAILKAMMSSASEDEHPLLMSTDYEQEASIAALANLADLLARDLILERLRSDGCLANSPAVGQAPLELAGQLAGLS